MLTFGYVCVTGQGALAYATAKTHGLDEKAEEIGEGLEELPPVNQDARLLQPPTPILRLDNWALLQVSKGFFENLAAKTARGESLEKQVCRCEIANCLWLVHGPLFRL